MGNSAIYDALAGSLYSGKTDGLGIAAQGIVEGGKLAYNPYASTGQNLTYSVGGSILAGLLGGLAQRRADNRNAALFQQAAGLGGMDTAQRQAVVKQHPRLTNYALALGQDERTRTLDLQNEIYKQNLLQDIKTNAAGKEAANKILGEQAAYNSLMPATKSGDAADVVNLMNPLSKGIYENEAKLRADIDSSKLGTQFTDIKANFEAMKDTYPFDSAAASKSFIASFARILDPGSTVREGEIRNAENTQSLLDSMGYKLKSLFDGTQSLSNDAKQAILQAAAAKYNTFGSNYQGFVEQQKGQAQRFGGDPANVYGSIQYNPFDFNKWVQNPPQTQTIAQQQQQQAQGQIDPTSAQIIDELGSADAIRKKIAEKKASMTDEMLGLWGVR